MRIHPEPAITYVGPVAVWWIPRPRGPRISVRYAAIGWLVLLPLVAATCLIIEAQSESLWPFGRGRTSPAQLLMRYELIAVVYLTYVTLRSLPAWLRYRRLARADIRALPAAIEARQWERAALLMHRYCLLVSAVWKRLPVRVSAWDSLLRPHMTRHRRVYLYYDGAPPALPPDVTSGFTPAIIPPSRPALWSLLILIPLALLLYLLFMEIARRGEWELMLTFNIVLLTILLVGYGLYFALALLGRSQFYRLAPGVAQLVTFAPGRRRPRIEAYDLRDRDVTVDLSTPWIGLTLLGSHGVGHDLFRLPRTPEAVDAVLRAALSNAPTPPLPTEQLLE